MNLSTFAAEVTEIIDAEFAGRGGFFYPDSFDSDVEACFRTRMSAKAAANKLMGEYHAAHVNY